MSLELALRRLSIRPSSSICQQCRRTLVSSAIHRQQQSATGAFAETLQSQRNPRIPNPPQRRAQPLASAFGNPETPPPATTSEPARPNTPRTSYDLATSTIRDVAEATKRREAKQRADALEKKVDRVDLERQVGRRWKVGDVYAPHDLTGVEQAKWKKLRRGGKRRAGRTDVVDQLGIRPVEHYKNFSIMSEYMSDMGRIKHSNETGLRPVNQRRMAKAIRRAIGIGLMPGVHRHPEILRMEMSARRQG